MLYVILWLIVMIYCIPLYFDMTKKLEKIDVKKYTRGEWILFGIMIILWPLTFIAYVHLVIGFKTLKDVIEDLKS